MEHRFVAEGLISSALGLKPLCCSDIKDGIPALQAEFCSDQHNLLGQLEMQLWGSLAVELRFSALAYPSKQIIYGKI